MLDIYLKNIDIFKEQMLLILQNITKDIKNLQETTVIDPIALPISAANVNYTKADESTVPLDTYLADIVTDIQATNNKVETDIETRLSSLEENSEDYLLKVPYKEQIDNYLPTISKTLNTYTSNSEITAYDNNAIFQYYKNGVKICLQDLLTQVLNIKKSTGTVMLGSCSNNKGIVSVGGEMLNLYGKEKISMYLSDTTYRTNFSFNYSSI
jgi:hypothetical protein